MPFVSRTRATLRSAELGFLGVVVYTRVHTPRFWGHDFSAGAPVLLFTRRRPWRISWLRVGTVYLQPLVSDGLARPGRPRHPRRNHNAPLPRKGPKLMMLPPVSSGFRPLTFLLDLGLR